MSHFYRRDSGHLHAKAPRMLTGLALIRERADREGWLRFPLADPRQKGRPRAGSGPSLQPVSDRAYQVVGHFRRWEANRALDRPR